MQDRLFSHTPDADDGCLTGMSLGSTTSGCMKERHFFCCPMNAGERLISIALIFLCIHAGYDGDRAFGAR